MARNCFYSFHFKPDNWRAATVRGIGVIEGNEPVKDNEWESITSGADSERKIEAWIAGQLKGKTCIVVLVGTNTANRKWISYEISKAWNEGLGVVAINIHGLKDKDGTTSSIGANPLDFVSFTQSGKALSTVAKRYDPAGANSKERYDWIATHLANAVEEAIKIRAAN